jgi:hypothetical protein
VGKGALRRVNNLSDRNPYHKRIVAKYGRENILMGMVECSSHEIAYSLEMGIIKCLKRMGVELSNLTAGGDGGRDPSEETRAKLSEAAKNRGVSQATRDAVSKAKKGVPLSEEQKTKQRITMLGKKFTEEHRKNISISAKKRGMSKELLEKARVALIGRVQSEEEKNKRSKKLVQTLESTGKTSKVFVDDVLYVSLRKAAEAISVTPSAILYGLRGSGVVQGHSVRYAE